MKIQSFKDVCGRERKEEKKQLSHIPFLSVLVRFEQSKENKTEEIEEKSEWKQQQHGNQCSLSKY